MSKTETLLEIRHLSKTFADSQPLRDINCTIRKGEAVSIIGPSGTGKSTLLRCINRLEQPTGGKIFFRGEEIVDKATLLRPIRQKIGMVFQSFNLFSNLNVMQNIIKGPMMLKGIPRDVAVQKAMELLETVGLREKAESWPDELSGGQKQRVAIARTLAMEPELILFDEPTSALDPRMVDDVLSVIRSLAIQKYTMMIVTHEMRFAQKVSDRIFFMNEGVIYEEGTPQEIFHSPKREATKIFINRLKTFERIFGDEKIDLPQIQGEIEAFARNQFMSLWQSMRLQLIFEELVYGILRKRGRDIFPIELKIMYNETLEKCEVKTTYGGDSFNPWEESDEDDALSVTILKGAIAEMNFCFAEKNILSMKVR